MTATCRECGQLTGKPYARYCDAHRWTHRGKPSTYKLTHERETYLRAHYKPNERGTSQRCATVLQVPKWRVCRWAAQLGLTSGVYRNGAQAWTSDEDTFLERHISSRHPNWIARRLGRSLTAVIVRSKRLRLSRKPDGYSQTDVALGFGVERGTVERWIQRGWLATNPCLRGSSYGISDASLRRFIAAHPTAFSLAKVEQVWFLGLLCGDFIRDKAA